ncbi:hypothetical protein NDU88_008626 [Pleurodeles waltl]|uniref:Uncharacterized protein n=1 Tax=Pleurodeles waltl TaxID=8319 RepID=A0AAV7QR79_PLEWA|nr:hypothetical protein NDU88_008626 [Pleurodeles waltl]
MPTPSCAAPHHKLATREVGVTSHVCDTPPFSQLFAPLIWHHTCTSEAHLWRAAACGNTVAHSVHRAVGMPRGLRRPNGGLKRCNPMLEEGKRQFAKPLQAGSTASWLTPTVRHSNPVFSAIPNKRLLEEALSFLIASPRLVESNFPHRTGSTCGGLIHLTRSFESSPLLPTSN